MKNLKSAFTVKFPDQFEGGRHMIVDDVFTTGTTVFELSRQLREAGSAGIGILTVAMA
jgi:predicted amidophosphoribosyltransferase